MHARYNKISMTRYSLLLATALLLLEAGAIKTAPGTGGANPAGSAPPPTVPTQPDTMSKISQYIQGTNLCEDLRQPYFNRLKDTDTPAVKLDHLIKFEGDCTVRHRYRVLWLSGGLFALLVVIFLLIGCVCRR